MNKKSIEYEILLLVVFIVVAGGAIFFSQYQSNQKQLAVVNEPDAMKTCAQSSDTFCSQQRCEGTFGKWTGCITENEICSSCKCPAGSAGWVYNFGCYYPRRGD